MAMFKYDASCEGELSIEEGEVIREIQETAEVGWLYGKGIHGVGQFPKDYVQVVEDAVVKKYGSNDHLHTHQMKEEKSEKSMGEEKSVMKVRALYDFAPQDAGELTFKEGDILIIRKADDPDWWDAEIDGRAGAIPAAYVETI